MFQGASRHLVISKVSSSFYNLTNKTLLSVFESFDKKLEENVSGQKFFFAWFGICKWDIMWKLTTNI